MFETFDEVSTTYGPREQLEFHQHIEEVFNLYEKKGFADTFQTPYEDMQMYNGKPFRIDRRVSNVDDDVDLEVVPIK